MTTPKETERALVNIGYKTHAILNKTVQRKLKVKEYQTVIEQIGLLLISAQEAAAKEAVERCIEKLKLLKEKDNGGTFIHEDGTRCCLIDAITALTTVVE